jgi:acyl carrier protein
MNREILEQLRAFIYQNFLFRQEFVLGDSDSFLANGLIDSTGVLELVAFLEETFGIIVEDRELTPENLDTFENLTAYVVRKLDGRAAMEPSAGRQVLV